MGITSLSATTTALAAVWSVTPSDLGSELSLETGAPTGFAAVGEVSSSASTATPIARIHTVCSGPLGVWMRQKDLDLADGRGPRSCQTGRDPGRNKPAQRTNLTHLGASNHPQAPADAELPPR